MCDLDNSRVQQFRYNGVTGLAVGERGVENGQLSFPEGIDVSPDGTVLYIVDTGNNRIQQFYLGHNTLAQPISDRYAGTVNEQLVVGAPGVLANDSDIDNDPLVALTAEDQTAQGGTVTLYEDGGFVYERHKTSRQ